MHRIRLGISTCPNDTFAFHAILNRKIDLGDLEFDVHLADVQELNNSFLNGRYDVAKVSFHAALLCSADSVVMPSGSALGFGVGPVLLSHQAEMTPDSFAEANLSPTVFCPGELTTATLLYELFHEVGNIEQVVFSDIMPRLQEKAGDFGVCIHEGRFSYADQGLHLIEDLGESWEKKTGSPLPLGGIVARESLGVRLLGKVQQTIQRSLEYACANRHETLATMREHAQEFSDEVLFAHVDLYVNEWTLELGAVGQSALDQLASIAHSRGLVDSGARLKILAAT